MFTFLESIILTVIMMIIIKIISFKNYIHYQFFLKSFIIFTFIFIILFFFKILIFFIVILLILFFVLPIGILLKNRNTSLKYYFTKTNIKYFLLVVLMMTMFVFTLCKNFIFLINTILTLISLHLLFLIYNLYCNIFYKIILFAILIYVLFTCISYLHNKKDHL
ncbi:Putative UPF0259 membrane protein YciC [Buchnera aphidicola (Pterocallis alni)]